MHPGAVKHSRGRPAPKAVMIGAALLFLAVIAFVAMSGIGLPASDMPSAGPRKKTDLAHLEELAKEDLRVSSQEKEQLSNQGKVLSQILKGLNNDTAASSRLLELFDSMSAKISHLESKLSGGSEGATVDDKTGAKKIPIRRTLFEDKTNPSLIDYKEIDWLELGKSAPECQDRMDKCADWAKKGECEKNSGYMAQNCRQSCGIPCVPEAAWRQQVTMEQVSWQPRAFHIHRLLHPAECEYIVKVAGPLLERSHVMEHETGKELVDPIRDSWGMFMGGDLANDPVVVTIDNRVAHFAMVPPAYGEAMQVLRYNKGQHYFAHGDYFKSLPNMGRGDHPGAPGQQRIATMLMFLRGVDEGGETHFPYGKPMPGAPPANATCGTLPKKGISIQPVQGNSVLFYSRMLTGDMDIRSTHAGCPVVTGQKWSATKWLRDGSLELTWKPEGEPVFGDENEAQGFSEGERR